MQKLAISDILLIIAISAAACTPAPSPIATANALFSHPFVAAGDLTGDGRNDIIFADSKGLNLLVNLGNGNFSEGKVVYDNSNSLFGQPTIAISEVTGDHLPDIIIGDKNGVLILKNLGGGNFKN